MTLEQCNNIDTQRVLRKIEMLIVGTISLFLQWKNQDIVDNNNTKANAKLIFAAISDNTYDENYTFDEFINELHMTNDQYIHAIQCSLNRSTIMLERKPSDTWTNNFAHHIPEIWLANTNS